MTMDKEKKLNGLHVVYFESRHSKTLGDLITIQGGVPVAAPAMKEVPIDDNAEALAFGEKLFRNEIDILVLLTGVGTRSLVTVLESRHPREKILAALKKTTLIPRGPKPVRVLNEWGVPFAFTVPEPNTWRELLGTLDAHQKSIPLSGKNVAVQEYGVSNPELLDGLRERGALVTRVPVYRWALPDDERPLIEAITKIVSGQLLVAVFTTAVQAEHLFQVAKKMKLDEALKKAFQRVVVASVGPDCSEALRNRGLPVDIEPESPKMGPLILATAERATQLLAKKKSDGNCSIEVSSVKKVDRRQNTEDEIKGLSAVYCLPSTDEVSQSIFLKACRREETPVTPVWLMRQAGRYMKDYRVLREKTGFLELCKDPSLAAQVTVEAQEKLDTDAAIIFSDILLILEPMGLSIDYPKGNGPLIPKAVRDAKAVDAVKELNSTEPLSFVFQAIREARKKLKPHIPLIGFAGAPFTLASYMIEGGSTKDFTETKKFMKADAGRWKILMQKIARSTVFHLNAQIRSGVQAVQLFDSWAGVLSGEEYEKFAAPYTKDVIGAVQKGIPVIHFGTKTGDFLEKISLAGGDVIGVDHRIGLEEAWKQIGPDKAIQGNLDPNILCGDLKEVRRQVQRILKEAAGRPGHIFNLGHGVLPETPEENAAALVAMVHEMSRR